MLQIKNKKQLNQFIIDNANLIREEINEKNREISGVKFEVIAYSDYKSQLDERDYNAMLYGFMLGALKLHPENFELLAATDKIYTYLGYQFQRKCLRILRNNSGDMEIKKDDYDYRIKFWIKRNKKSLLDSKKKYLSKEEIDYIFKIILLKYN